MEFNSACHCESFATLRINSANEAIQLGERKSFGLSAEAAALQQIGWIAALVVPLLPRNDIRLRQYYTDPALYALPGTVR